jgi:phosphopantetheine adenylyltransferase
MTIQELEKEYFRSLKIDRILQKIYNAIIKSKSRQRTNQLDRRVDLISQALKRKDYL